MTDDKITLRLSRADAELIADLADTGLDRETSFPSMDGFTPAYRAELDRLREDGQRVIKLIYATLAALAEGPERAATGETGYYIGVDAYGQKVRVANNVHFTDSRKRKRAAVQRAAGEPQGSA